MIAAGDEKEVKSSDTVVKKNQLINFDYEGKVNGKAFDGGTAESQFLRVGSGKMIDGFEDALVGMKVGEKKDAKVTFPKDYRETSLAGKEAVFTLKVNYIYKEATDALVAKLDSTYNTKTVKAFKEAAKKELESQNEQQMLSTAMSKITSEAKISKVPDELIKKIKAIQSKSLESQATLVDDDHAGHICLFAHAHCFFGADNGTGNCAANDNCGIGKSHCFVYFAIEIKETGSVNKVYFGSVPLKGSNSCADGNVSFGFFGIIVGNGRAVVNLAHAVEKPCIEKHCFSQSGFAFSAVAEDGNIADAVSLIVFHIVVYFPSRGN